MALFNRTSSAVAEEVRPAADIAGDYVLDPAHTRIGFSARHAMVTKVRGQFDEFEGAAHVDTENPAASTVAVTIQAASVATGQAQRDGHLKSPDFFDAAKFPHATFTSTAIKAGGDNGATHTVTGNLELHGVTRAITFPAKIKIDGDGVSVDAEFAINRKDFGINYPGMADDLIKDDVLILLKLAAKKS